MCERMIAGESLRSICESPGMPSRRVIFNWLDKNEEFRAKYELARQMQVEWWAHEIIEIADDSSGDFVINERGERVVDNENIQRSRLRVDSRKWVMAKLHPARYGDKITADITVKRDMKELTDSELLQIAGSGVATTDGSEDESSQTDDTVN
jgi:hypothetical protein